MTEDQLSEIYNYLKNESYKNLLMEDNRFLLGLTVEGIEIQLYCEFDEFFPYSFPIIKIDKESYNIVGPLPHVNRDYSICTFDTNIVIPNFRAPELLVNASIDQAVSTITKGIRKENVSEFLEEFSSYWEMDCNLIGEIIFKPGDTAKILPCYHGRKIYISETESQLKDYLKNMGISKKQIKSIDKCLYLPLKCDLMPPFPVTNMDFYKLIENHPDFELYNKYLQNKLPDEALVAFSVMINGKPNVNAWIHSKISIPNGFRAHYIPPKLGFENDKKGKKPKKICIEDMNQERIFLRTGVEKSNTMPSAMIIGCGALGSNLAESLAQYGIVKLGLVDNENLSYENIARHYCGYSDVGSKKVDSVKNALIRHNPNINCSANDLNAHKYMDMAAANINNNYDIVFMVTGNAPLEYHLIEKFNSGAINGPIIIMWVEPYLMAGHAVIMNVKQDIYETVFNHDFAFKDNVVEESEKYNKKEAGCQSTYMPYSGFELKQFIYSFLEYLFNENLRKEKKGNYIFTRCGKLSEAKKQGIKITENWKNAEDFSIHIKRFD